MSVLASTGFGHPNPSINRSKHCFCHDRQNHRRSKIVNIKEMLNRVLDVLKDNHTTWFYVELPKIDMEALRKKIIAILKDKHGGIGTIPDDEIEALADVLLPGVIKFFSSDEWRAEFEEWKKERELLLAQREEQKVLALKADETKVS
jgi:hypothetical protein